MKKSEQAGIKNVKNIAKFKMIYILKARGKENEKKNLRRINILKKLQKWLNWICLKLNKF